MPSRVESPSSHGASSCRTEAREIPKSGCSLGEPNGRRAARSLPLRIGDEIRSEDDPMLRLRTVSTPAEILLILEGRLAGPWIVELARCWSRLREDDHAVP